MACKILHCFFRFLFVMTLILVAIKGCCEINDNKGFVSQNLRIISEKLSFEKLMECRAYSGLIILIENYLLILTALFLLLGFKFAKCTGFLAIMIELILVHNPIFYGEAVYRGIASQYLGILGGILVL